MKRLIEPLSGVLVVALAMTACAGGSSDESQGGVPPDLVPARVERAPAEATDVAKLVEGLNEFGFDYYRLVAEGSDGDIVFSPLSIAIAFGMLDAGARGETADQLAEFFGYPVEGDALHEAFNALDQALEDSGDSILRLANRLYPDVDFELRQDFVDTLAAQYGSELERLDFGGDTEGSRETINSWVSERTEGLIPELLKKGVLEPDAVLVLVNAVYLEAAWSQPFEADLTSDDDFTRLDGSTVDAPMMHNRSLQTSYVEGEGFDAVELPYDQGDLSMLVIVPDAGQYTDLESAFDAGQVAAIDAGLTAGTVSLALPRWDSSFEDNALEQSLPELGLTLPFSSAANLSGISPTAPYVKKGVHAAEIEVDEEGTVAAAATALILGESSAPSSEVSIEADKPFLYLIRDTETGMVLFQGRVLDPTA